MEARFKWKGWPWVGAWTNKASLQQERSLNYLVSALDQLEKMVVGACEVFI